MNKYKKDKMIVINKRKILIFKNYADIFISIKMVTNIITQKVPKFFFNFWV